MRRYLMIGLLLLTCTFAFAQQNGFVLLSNGFPTANATVLPTSLSFGTAVIGTTTAAQTVTLTVVGNADLTVQGIAFGTNNFLAAVNHCSGVIPAGTSCTIDVVFSPQSAASFSDALTVTSNSPSSPDVITLTGTGQNAATNPAVTLSATTLNFGNVNVGTSSPTLSVTLSNSGTSTLNITSTNFATGTHYTKTSTCGATLAINTSCAVTIACAPQSTGSKPDTLAVVTNASTSPDNVALSCTGVSSGGGLAASPFFGYSNNSRSNGNAYPTQLAGVFGLDRIHDGPPINWPHMNPSAGVYNYTEFDAMLQTDFDNGITEVEMNIGRTPPWISSGSNDNTKCTYPSTSSTPGTTDSNGRGWGECYAPSDLNADGTGTNATFKAWITALATHANDTNYLNGTGVWAAHGANCNRAQPCKHAHLRYWELTNEPDDGCNGTSNACFVHMSIAALAREMEDMACILLGSQSGRRVIHQSGNGNATACAASPIDSTALIVMPPTHGKGAAVTYTQNLLYCNTTGSLSSWQLPCPNPTNAISTAVDIIAEHFKPGAEGTTASTCGSTGNKLCSVETALQLYVANISNMLQGADKTKPMWDDEFAYCPKGFTDTACSNGLYADDDLSASFFPRAYLMLWTLGLQSSAFYTTGDALSQTGTKGPISWGQTASYLTGATLTTPCAVTGTLWKCTITNGATTYLIVWDTSKTCASGTCTTAVQNIPTFTQMTDMTATPNWVAVPGSHNVNIGIKPTIFK